MTPEHTQAPPAAAEHAAAQQPTTNNPAAVGLDALIAERIAKTGLGADLRARREELRAEPDVASAGLEAANGLFRINGEEYSESTLISHSATREGGLFEAAVVAKLWVTWLQIADPHAIEIAQRILVRGLMSAEPGVQGLAYGLLQQTTGMLITGARATDAEAFSAELRREALAEIERLCAKAGAR